MWMPLRMKRSQMSQYTNMVRSVSVGTKNRPVNGYEVLVSKTVDYRRYSRKFG